MLFAALLCVMFGETLGTTLHNNPNASLIIGRDVTLICSMDNLTSTVSWETSRYPLSPLQTLCNFNGDDCRPNTSISNENYTFTSAYLNRQYYMHIHYLTWEDEATYTCIQTNVNQTEWMLNIEAMVPDNGFEKNENEKNDSDSIEFTTDCVFPERDVSVRWYYLKDGNEQEYMPENNMTIPNKTGCPGSSLRLTFSFTYANVSGNTMPVQFLVKITHAALPGDVWSSTGTKQFYNLLDTVTTKTPTTPTPIKDTKKNNHDFSTVEIVLIAIGSVILLICIYTVFKCMQKRKSTEKQKNQENIAETNMTNTSTEIIHQQNDIHLGESNAKLVRQTQISMEPEIKSREKRDDLNRGRIADDYTKPARKTLLKPPGARTESVKGGEVNRVMHVKETAKEKIEDTRSVKPESIKQITTNELDKENEKNVTSTFLSGQDGDSTTKIVAGTTVSAVLCICSLVGIYSCYRYGYCRCCTRQVQESDNDSKAEISEGAAAAFISLCAVNIGGLCCFLCSKYEYCTCCKRKRKVYPAKVTTELCLSNCNEDTYRNDNNVNTSKQGDNKYIENNEKARTQTENANYFEEEKGNAKLDSISELFLTDKLVRNNPLPSIGDNTECDKLPIKKKRKKKKRNKNEQTDKNNDFT